MPCDDKRTDSCSFVRHIHTSTHRLLTTAKRQTGSDLLQSKSISSSKSPMSLTKCKRIRCFMRSQVEQFPEMAAKAYCNIEKANKTIYSFVHALFSNALQGQSSLTIKGIIQAAKETKTANSLTAETTQKQNPTVSSLTTWAYGHAQYIIYIT